MNINRRRSLALMALTMGNAARPAFAQGSGRVARIGFLLSSSMPANGISPMVDEVLAELGRHAQGAALKTELQLRWGGAGLQALERGAAELVAWPADIIVTQFTPASLAAGRATNTIPIVMHLAADPDRSGLIKSFAQPGGNVTGIAARGQELVAKNVELLRQWRPAAKRLAVLAQASDPWAVQFAAAAEAAAKQLGMQTLVGRASDAASYEQLLGGWAAQGVDAVLMQPTLDRAAATPTVRRHRLLTFSLVPGWVEQSALFALSPDLAEANEAVADLIVRLVRGEKPSNLPVHLASRFTLRINARVARELGLEIPAAIRLRATGIVE